jgi:predicted nucleotidyltransferase
MTDVKATPLREVVDARREEIKAIAARHHGRSIALFGSAARGDDHAGSDLDFLVEFEPGARPFELLLLGAELEDALGVPVDVGTRQTLRQELRDEVLAEAVPLWVARTPPGWQTSSPPSRRSTIT